MTICNVEDTVVSKYLNGLKSFREDDFTKLIVCPLFEAMGYQRVEFHGGVNERGRDLIATIRIPPSKTPKVIYVQSKKIGKQDSVSARQISDIGHQIRTACFEGFKTLDGEVIKPTEAYIACPEKISQRFLDELGPQFANLPIKINFFDGIEIIEGISEYKKSLLGLLDSFEDKIYENDKKYLGNSDLLGALCSIRDEVEVQDFYSDLSFFVGSLDSNLLMHLDITFNGDDLFLQEDEWKRVKSEIILLENEFGINILSSSISEIENRYKKDSDDYNSKINLSNWTSYNSLKSNRDDLLSRLSSNITNMNESINMFIVNNKLCSKKSSNLNYISKKYSESIEKLHKNKEVINIINIDLSFLSEYKKFENVLCNYFATINSLIKEININLKDILETEAVLIHEAKYTLCANIDLVSSELSRRRDEYISSVSKINKKEINFAELKFFLKETERTLYLLSKIISKNSPLRLFINEIDKCNYVDRVSISPIDVFSSGYDIAVYGGAGVGKTTTLEKYKQHLEKDKTFLPIFIPLNKIVSTLSSDEDVIFSYDESGIRQVGKSELIYKLILIFKRIEVSQDNIVELKKYIDNKTVLILDGIDEVYNIIPGLFDGINEFKMLHPDTQIVVSSRDCVSYLDKINFLGITLLPFTKEQINRFIRGWFSHKEDIGERLISNISSRNLYDSIQVPLNLTITCSLVEKGVDAPSTESEIYEARLDLLTGEYDKFKKINRQSNQGTILKKIAVKLAYIMHKKHVRSIRQDEAEREVSKLLGSKYSHSLISSVINDLVDPCNLLIVDRYSEELSFGHFRFQEHLAATELAHSRGVDMADLAREDWWRGALCLFAQTNDMEFLIPEIYQKFHSIGSTERTLRAMQEQTINERKHIIKSIIDSYIQQDAMDEIVSDYGYSDYSEYANRPYYL